MASTSARRHNVELDADIELALFKRIALEYSALRQHLPRTVAPSLRFRKTGRHKAIGVYHARRCNIAVDPRAPHSFVHEYAHHLDYTHGERMLSARESFRPILRAAQEHIDTLDVTAAKRDYLSTPTEVFARSAAVYFAGRYPNTSLNWKPGKERSWDYGNLIEMRDDIEAFWDELLVELGAAVPHPMPAAA